ncbi:helix-turn-helix domain-containing protein [Streptomyces sp. NPDC088554]|uniref:helix-turn-helix domain-containing protein n=1 Tax=Streptomyces sp. NPDC088554 TaxID=3365865 RepID=UPI0037F47AB6
MELDNEEEKVTPRTVLGRALRRERDLVNLSLRALADGLGYPHSYISRVEHGKQLPSDELAEALDTRFGTRGLFAGLLAMEHGLMIPDYSRKVVSKESEASRIQVFTSSLVPGLLQTEGYARELFRKSIPGESEEACAERVAVRVRRQRIFERPDPVFYWAIMDEAALRRPMGTAKNMVGQMNHLLEMAARPHITIQVLPFDKGAYPMLGGSLTIMTLKQGGTIALVESFASGTGVESAKRVLEFTTRFDSARSMALADDESINLIRTYLKGYGNECDS